MYRRCHSCSRKSRKRCERGGSCSRNEVGGSAAAAAAASEAEARVWAEAAAALMRSLEQKKKKERKKKLREFKNEFPEQARYKRELSLFLRLPISLSTNGYHQIPDPKKSIDQPTHQITKRLNNKSYRNKEKDKKKEKKEIEREK